MRAKGFSVRNGPYRLICLPTQAGLFFINAILSVLCLKVAKGNALATEFCPGEVTLYVRRFVEKKEQ